VRNILLFFLYFSLLVIHSGCEGQPFNKLEPFKKRELKSKALSTNLRADVDILFIIDDSSSMTRHQDNLIQAMDQLIDVFFRFGFVNYHMGVISSSIGQYSYTNGVLRSDAGFSFVDPYTDDGSEVIKEYIRLGIGGSVSEQFFKPLVLALDSRRTPQNEGFLRRDSQLLVIFLTDSDDQSELSAAQAYQQTIGLLGNKSSRLNVAGAIIEGDIPPCGRGGEPRPTKLSQFFNLTRASVFSLCDSDFGEPMAKIATSLVSRATRFKLDQVPDITTIRLSYGTQVIPLDIHAGWSYVGETNEIILGSELDLKPEPLGTKLKFTFEPAYEKSK